MGQARARQADPHHAGKEHNVSPSGLLPFRRPLVVSLLTIALGVAALAAAAPAFATPTLGVEATHIPTTISRGDERLTYEVTVKNSAPNAPVAVGDELTCQPGKWNPVAAPPTFAYQWFRDGASLGSANGADTATYAVQAADEGHSLQCEVIATNANATTTNVTAPLVVPPPPSTPPPAPLEPTKPNSRPAITGTASSGSTIECKAPASWSGSPTWTFLWLREGSSAETHGEVTETTATTSKYKVAAEDVPGIIQCEAIATNAGGSAVAISNNKQTSPAVTQPPANEPANGPSITTPNFTTGPVTVELLLPEGEETRPLSAAGVGWTCTTQAAGASSRANATCTRSDALSPGASYPTITVSSAIGADAPNPAIANATVSGGGSAASSTEDVLAFGPALGFGIAPGTFKAEVLDAAGSDYTQAGGHPFSAATSFTFNQRMAANGFSVPVDHVRDVAAELPAGFLGNPRAVPQLCDNIEDVLQNTTASNLCPPGSVVGGVVIQATQENGEEATYEAVVYAIQPERGAPAQFAFQIGQAWLYSLTASLRPDETYAISVEAPKVAKMPQIRGIAVTFCGFGTKVGGIPIFPPVFAGCKEAGEDGANPKPLLTNPTQCTHAPPITALAVDSWENPGEFKRYQAESPEVTGCASVPFEPQMNLQPTSRRADTPTGLGVNIAMPTEGLETASGTAQADLKRAVVTLPQGMTVNPAAADGLAACTSAQIRLGTNDPVQCPEGSKIGSAEIVTPVLEDTLKGSVYLAKQGDNPFGSLLALYLVVESAERGILVKIPGKVTPDLTTGQLTATFDNNPQLPFSSLQLHFNEGNRAALLNPPSCGSYGIRSDLSPWSAANPDAPTAAETRSTTSTFGIDQGTGGGACPQGKLEPTLSAGLSNPVAASTSPFLLDLRREDGSQRFKGLDATLPLGVTAYLKGVPYCPDSALASISEAEGTGQGQIDSPACPAASQIGTVSVGVGGGSNPYYVNTGKAYLAGPYKGAPLSIAIVTPAVAGPFDLGSVVVRSAAFVNPETAQITVKSDPIPTILHGIPLGIRDIRVSIDRPSFMVAPTNCKESSVDALVQGEAGGTAAVSNRFQVADCAALPFKPKLALRVFGKTNRNSKPRFRAVLTQPAGQANIARAQVNLPHSLFLEQNHIKTVCTRVQWNEGAGNGSACPKGSIYGHARAFTPLLDRPLEGPVYLRSNGGERKLPDLVAALNGQVDIALWGKVDSGPNHGLRNTFEVVPDAPVSKFILEMGGGKKGLLVNSENLCSRTGKSRRAIVRFTAQSGKVEAFKPHVKASCGKKHKAHKRSSPRHGH